MSAEVLLHDTAKPHIANTFTGLLQKFKWDVLSHLPYSPDLSPCDYAIFGPLNRLWGAKMSSSTAEMVHNAAPGILRDSHSPPCVAVGKWFLFLDLRLISFWMPIIPESLSFPQHITKSMETATNYTSDKFYHHLKIRKSGHRRWWIYPVNKRKIQQIDLREIKDNGCQFLYHIRLKCYQFEWTANKN